VLNLIYENERHYKRHYERLISISGASQGTFDRVYRLLMTINKLLIYLAHN